MHRLVTKCAARSGRPATCRSAAQRARNVRRRRECDGLLAAIGERGGVLFGRHRRHQAERLGEIGVGRPVLDGVQARDEFVVGTRRFASSHLALQYLHGPLDRHVGHVAHDGGHDQQERHDSWRTRAAARRSTDAREGVPLRHSHLPDDGAEQGEHVQVGERVFEVGVDQHDTGHREPRDVRGAHGSMPPGENHPRR